MASNQWETVGKTTKSKTKPIESVKGKPKKKITPNDMPRIEAAAPVQESATIYDAFLEKERRQEARLAREQQTKSNDTTGKHPTKKKTAGPDKRKEPPLTVEATFAKLNAEELESILVKDQTTFPDSPLVWLKDLASILTLRLEKLPEPDPVLANKPKDYPVCLLPLDVRKLLIKTLSDCSSRTLDLFLEHCVQSMVADIGKGHVPTYGYRLFAQLVCHEKPLTAIDNLQKYVEMLNSNQNRQLRGLSILWAIGQPGVNNLTHGLKVWLEVMVKVMNIRYMSSYVIDYLQDLFKIHPDLTKAYGAISNRDFFPIMDQIFSAQSPLPPHLKKKLTGLYPKLKTVAFGRNSENNLRLFFPSFLTRCTPTCRKELKTELLECLVHCLSVDKHCFSVWRQMYIKHRTQTSILLEYILDNWSSVSPKLERKVLRDTVRAFSITNDELVAHDKGTPMSKEDSRKLGEVCQELLAKMSGSRFPWRLLLLLIFSTLVGVVSYDIYINKTFKKSQTCRLLTDTGLLIFLEQVWGKIQLYTGKALDWLADNVPQYYSKVCQVVGPYLYLFWEKLYETGVLLVQATAPMRAWIHLKLPQLLEWIDAKMPWLWTSVTYYSAIVWDFTVTYSILLWEFIVYYYKVVSVWLLKNVFTGSLSPDNMWKFLVSLLTSIQSYTVAGIHWCLQLVKGAN